MAIVVVMAQQNGEGIPTTYLGQKGVDSKDLPEKISTDQELGHALDTHTYILSFLQHHSIIYTFAQVFLALFQLIL